MRSVTLKSFRDAFHEFAVLNPARHGAALAYYGLFALVPLMAVGYQLVRLLLSEEALTVMAETTSRLAGVLGPATIAVIEQQVQEAAGRVGRGSVVVDLIAALALVYTASGAFMQLKYSLNTIWDVPYETQLRARSMIATRLMGIGLVLCVGILLVLSVLSTLLIGSLGDMVELGFAVPYLNAFTSLLLIAGSFTVLYRLLPDAPVSWRAAGKGGSLAAIGVVLALAAANLYFRYVRLNTALGVAGGLALLLIMTNYLAQIFLFGAVVSRRSRNRMPGTTAAPGTPSTPSASEGRLVRGGSGAHPREVE